MIVDLDETKFKEYIFNYDEGKNAPLLTRGSTVIEFWVTWCKHCQAMVPRYEEVSEKFPNVDFYRIELEKHPELASLLKVASFPTFIFITKRYRIERYVGEVSTDELINLIKQVLGEKECDDENIVKS